MSAEDYVNQCMKWHKIPARYKEADFYNLKGSDAFMRSVKQISQWNFKEPYLCALLSANHGMGKTHLAWSLLRMFMLKAVMADFNKVDTNKHLYTNFFFKEYEILNHIKSAYGNENTSEESIKNIYKNKKLLIIDDLFRTKRTDWSLAVWFEILDFRYDNFKPTIITSNFLIDEIRSEIDTSIVSRIQNSMTFEFTGNLIDFRSTE